MVGEIGLGCMSLGTDEARARSIIDEAIELGINFFDTADLYDHGVNEQLLGQALKGRRNRVVLATKVGNRRVPGEAGWRWDPSKAYIKAAVHESLRRLQTDYIDLYQLHGGTIDDPIDETIEAFEELVQEGWIRYYGISSIRPNVIREYVRRSNIVTVMSQYSLLDRRPEEETLDLLHQHGIGLIARGPLAGGILTTHGLKKAADGYLDYSDAEVREVHAFVTDLAGESRTIEQTALRFSLSHPAVAVAIPGARTIEQLRRNVSAGRIPALTETELAEIRRHTKANVYTLHRS
jgi:aryl-alcohol dehydrogenase-like predicted oxidoreductase